MTTGTKFTSDDVEAAEALALMSPPDDIEPRLESFVTELISRVADKWTMLVLDVLAEKGPLRFSRLAEAVGGVSQKMLTQTLRAMERDGLVTRTIYPVIPPKVEYQLTGMGVTLGAAFCGVWLWAGRNMTAVEEARCKYDQQ